VLFHVSFSQTSRSPALCISYFSEVCSGVNSLKCSIFDANNKKQLDNKTFLATAYSTKLFDIMRVFV